MKPLLFSLALVISCQLCAQKQEPLYFFKDKNGLCGVKDSKGKIIIPAKHYLTAYEDGQKIEDEFINLVEQGDTSKDTRMAHGKMYDRNGKFLYRPLGLEATADEINEGLTRFVENGKIGFVNRHGKIIIPAKFDNVSSFYLGTAMFCTGCYYDKEKDSEHPLLAGGKFGIIDRNGTILVNDIPFEGKYKYRLVDSLQEIFYPSQFQYTALEKDILAKLEPYRKGIEKEHFPADTTTRPRSLIFDIVEKPSQGFNYYVVQSRDKVGDKIYSGAWDELRFYISKDGKTMYFHEYGGKLIPFQKWYDLYIKGVRDFE